MPAPGPRSPGPSSQGPQPASPIVGAPNARFTAFRAFVAAVTNSIRASQVVVEALYAKATGVSRVSHVVAEALYTKTSGPSRVSQVVVEALINTHGPVVVSQVVVEVLKPSADLRNMPFITSHTVVYSPTLVGNIDVPFISSATVVYPLTVAGVSTEIDIPFIPSNTRVFGVFSLFGDETGTGPGNGGELFPLRLNANGATETATLAASIGVGTGGVIQLLSDSGMPTDAAFMVTIDDEVLYVVPLGSHRYGIRHRAMSNTTIASHTAGSSVTWTDSYDQSIIAGEDIAHSFEADINSTGDFIYPGWLICFDSTQARLSGDRYPMHVTEVVGVFDAGAGVSGSNRLDGPQPSAIFTATGVSDDCPAALSVPARIETDIITGDVAVVRYTNPEATPLDLGPRSTALQSWFGIRRVDATNHDVTLTDPNGISVDTNAGVGTYTGSVNGEWHNPSAIGIEPVLSDLVGHAVPTLHPVPWTTVTLPGTDRYFTYGTPYGDTGWPMCCLAVRQDNRRIPFWQSWDWHNYAFVYSGWGTDCCYAQILINRNGIVFDSVPEVELPGTQDIDGPDAMWDDGTYYFGASWYIVLFSGPYLVAGPVITGPNPPLGPAPPGGYSPYVAFPGGAGGSPSITIPFIEGGQGGGISPPGSKDLHVWTRFP